MQGLPLFAVRTSRSPRAHAKFGLLGGTGGGEREFLEAGAFNVGADHYQFPSVHPPPAPRRLHPRGQHRQMPGVIAGNGNQFVVRQNGCIQKLKNPVLAFDGGDVAGQAVQRLA